MDYKDINRKAYNEVADAYADRDSLVIDETVEVKKALDTFVTHLKLSSHVLDVGCAGGRDSRYLISHGMKVTGIDLSPEMIRNAKERTKEGGEFMVMDFEHLEFPPNSFDGIWANASLHHVPKQNLPSILKNLFAILKSGGAIHIVVKQGNFDGLKTLKKFGVDFTRHFSFYTKEEIERLIEEAGFKVIKSHLATANEWLHILSRK